MIEELKAELMKRLRAVTPSWTTRVEGRPFTPNVTQPYQEAYLIPLSANRIKPAFGFGKTSFPSYTYQVNLYYPVREGGIQLLHRRADVVSAAFYPTHGRGAVIEFGNHSAIFDDLPQPGPLIEGNSFYMLPLDIPFFCQINPTA